MEKNIRYAGVLLHPTSLAGGYGIGDLGKSAYDFVDFLVDAKVGLWQILPLGPVGFGNSPYASRSSFAGNELLINLDFLVEESYLSEDQLNENYLQNSNKVDFEAVSKYKWPLLVEAAKTFIKKANKKNKQLFESFCGEHHWLEDYALFQSMNEYYQDSRWFLAWDEKLAKRETKSLEAWKKKNYLEVEIYKVLQFFFYKQWLELKNYANKNGVAIVGDLPIFVAHDSSDAWANQNLLKLDEDGLLEVSSGVPPDAFSSTGQLWGNPLYDWDKMEAEGYQWWISRLIGQFKQTDIVRIDHFRGFESYWEVPATEETAVNGKWVKGPAQKFFDKLHEEFGTLAVIAEDLGVITKEVELLRDNNNFIGMKIAHFAFELDKNGFLNTQNSYLPHNYDQNCVAYTGTHDNDTTVGWFSKLDDNLKDLVRRYLSCDDNSVCWYLMRSVMASTAKVAIIPAQDLLELGGEARFNLPGSCGDFNWAWRLEENQLTIDMKNRLKELSQLFGRSSSYKEIKQLFKL